MEDDGLLSKERELEMKGCHRESTPRLTPQQWIWKPVQDTEELTADGKFSIPKQPCYETALVTVRAARQAQG